MNDAEVFNPDISYTFTETKGMKFDTDESKVSDKGLEREELSDVARSSIDNENYLPHGSKRTMGIAKLKDSSKTTGLLFIGSEGYFLEEIESVLNEASSQAIKNTYLREEYAQTHYNCQYNRNILMYYSKYAFLIGGTWLSANAIALEKTEPYPCKNMLHALKKYPNPVVRKEKRTVDEKEGLSNEQESTKAFKELTDKSNSELKNFSEHLPVSEEDACKIIDVINLKLSKISFSKLGVELTPMGTMKYNLVIEEGAILTVIAPLEGLEKLGEDGVMFNLRVNRESVRSGFADLDSLVDAANAYSS